jgi:hypothetical protein
MSPRCFSANYEAVMTMRGLRRGWTGEAPVPTRAWCFGLSKPIQTASLPEFRFVCGNTSVGTSRGPSTPQLLRVPRSSCSAQDDKARFSDKNRRHGDQPARSFQ